MERKGEWERNMNSEDEPHTTWRHVKWLWCHRALGPWQMNETHVEFITFPKYDKFQMGFAVMTNRYFTSVTVCYTFHNPFQSHSLLLVLKMRFPYNIYAKWFNDDTFFDDFEKFNYLCGSLLLCVYGIYNSSWSCTHAHTHAHSNISDSAMLLTAVFFNVFDVLSTAH